MGKLKTIWINLSSGLWFIPTLMVVGAVLLAFGLIEIDLWFGSDLAKQWPRFFGIGADGARGLLSSVAGSMITVAGVIFSITIVALALASNQFSPRLLRNFMRDRGNQVVLGVFVSIFAYCLVVLRTIRSGENPFVPPVSVSFAMLLALASIGFFIFFIHHVATAIQVSNLASVITKETIDALDNLFPENVGEAKMETPRAPEAVVETKNWVAISADRTGYIQAAEADALVCFAEKYQVVLRMERGIGGFVIKGTPLVSISSEKNVDEKMICELNPIFGIAAFRTIEQDPAYGVRQLVDIALKALSPGVNDTTTAVTCVDYLTAILVRLASRQIPSSRRYEEGKLRVIAIGPTFESLLAESFDQIRVSAKGNVAIQLRILDAQETIASLTANPIRRQALREQVEWIAELAARTIESPHDRTRFESRLAQVREALKTEPVLSIHQQPTKA